MKLQRYISACLFRSLMARFLLAVAALALLATAGCSTSTELELQAPRLSLLAAPDLIAAGLKSSAGAPEGIVLTWQRVTDPRATSYYIYRDTQSIPDPAPGETIDPLLRTNGGLSLPNPDSGETVVFNDIFPLDIGQTYFYRITVVDNQDPPEESPPSNEVSWEAHGQNVTGVAPAMAYWGDNVTISGDTFGTYDDTTDQVFFSQFGGGMVEGAVVSWDATEIVATVPVNADTGPVSVVVETTMASSDNDLQILNPLLDGIDPAIGFVEQPVTLAGRNLKPAPDSTLEVWLAGVDIVGSQVTWDNSELVLNMPVNAVEGELHLVVDGHESNRVTFTPRAEILDIAPPSAQNGERITISGRYFGAAEGLVQLNLSEDLAIVDWTDSLITAELTGSSGPAQITVETAGGIVSNVFDYEIIGELTITLSGIDPTKHYAAGNLPVLVVTTAADTERVELVIDGTPLAESTTFPFDNLTLPLAQLTNGTHMIHARAHRRSISANSNSFNISTYSLVGDVNGDGVVDDTDRDALQPLIGLNAANPEYRPWFDTDDDGYITEADLAGIGYNFGNTVSP